MAGKKWNREARKTLLGLTGFAVGWYLFRMAGDYITEGPQRITVTYLVARAAVMGVFWLVAVLLLRRWVRSTDSDSGDRDD